MEQSILNYVENSFSENIPHPTLITLLCIKGGVTFSETKEKCPRASHLTLIGVLKTLAQGEEVERERKKRRSAIELPREVTLQLRKSQKLNKEGGGGGGGGLKTTQSN